jgi:two-component system sensor histidine kinase KdpD
MAQSETLREARPDPDALLAAAEAEARGKLKIFLGAAPGVGKTYAMLSGARQLERDGVDVVIGLVETHGRAETSALLEGLEILPRRKVSYRGHQIEEFDLDAALARRPALIVVDELAHTNAPESRHPKRYQDVEELLRAGIDVWTAINIQHLESLSDVVSKIAGVAIRETVPDTVLEKANDVVLVDITPAELIQRLREGKVYLPANALRAADHFFRPGNLTALRELALRRTADRVDDQMVNYLRQNAIEGAWPTAERIVVCVGPDPSSEAVVRTASRLASGLNASWVAVTLERMGGEIIDGAALARIDETMRLAERLGAETARLSGRDLPDELLRYARRENITQIVIGRSHAGFWGRLRGRSLSEAIIRRAEEIAVHVVVGPETKQRRAWHWEMPELAGLSLGLATAAVSVSCAVLIGKFITHFLPLPNVSMIFLTAVLVCAVTFGSLSAILAAIISVFAYNFFFIEPLYRFTASEPHELFALIIFLLVAVLTGSLAGRVREQSDASRKRIATIQALYNISRKLSATASLEDVLYVVAYQAASGIKGQALVLLPKDGDVEIRAAYPPEDTLGPGEAAAARWALRHGEVSGWRSGTLPNAQYQFHPMRTSRGIVGVVAIAPHERIALSAEDERVLSALLDQAAIAIERIQLADAAVASEAAAERERLRTALLSSISHDLRTPLASIVGSITSLRRYGERMPADARADLLAAIEEEAERLTRFVSNLLDMTRLETGSLDLRHDFVDLGEVVMRAAARARRSFPDREIETTIDNGLPLVRGDAVLLEQVLFNLFDNADKYVPKGTPTRVRVTLAGGELVLTVEDEGPGIPIAELQRVFEKFHRLNVGDGRPPGTGLGLAIARGVIDAMDGSIRAESPIRDGHGTRIVIRLPAAKDVAGAVPAG